jgi:hypothetical protein
MVDPAGRRLLAPIEDVSRRPGARKNVTKFARLVTEANRCMLLQHGARPLLRFQDELVALRRMLEVEDGDDARVRNLVRCVSFGREAVFRASIARQMLVQDLHGDVTPASV